MKSHKKSFSFILLIVISLTTSISHADREQDFKNVTSWAESRYSSFFSPASTIIQNQQPWLYTFYPETNTYIGLNNNDEIWVLGDVFGGLLQISKLDDLLNVIASENVGNGNCVQVPLISAGGRIVSRYYAVNPNNSSPVYGSMDETYTEYTNTHYTTANEVYVLKADGSSLTFEGTFTRWFTIIDNFIYSNSTKSVFVLENKSYTVTTEYSPELLSGSLSTICEGQTITHAPTQKISTFNGNTRITEIEASETIINSVNENIQVPAGNFTTVMSTNHTTSNTINKQWIDTATGHLIKAETYDTDNFILGDENGIYLKWMQEATLVQ